MSELIDNRAHRIKALKEIIQHLHAGAAPEIVKERLREIVRQTDATSFASRLPLVRHAQINDFNGFPSHFVVTSRQI